MASPAPAVKAATERTGGGTVWKMLARPLMQTVLNNHAQQHRVPQPLLLHGPRGVGKTSLLLHRLIPEWNKGPHRTAYVDFSPDQTTPLPWSSSVSLSTPSLSSLSNKLDLSLETLTNDAILLGKISSNDVFTTLNKRLGLHKTLKIMTGTSTGTGTRNSQLSVLWSKAVLSRLSKTDHKQIDLLMRNNAKSYSREEIAFMKESITALGFAEEIIRVQKSWRSESIRNLNKIGGFSRSLANSATDWPCLLIELLSEAAETDFFQPKLVLNNIDVLRNAISTDESAINASIYHDSLIWRIISLGANERSIPIFLVSSDGYYSYQAFEDFGYPDIFISREIFGWTPKEAKFHMVPNYFSESEWKVIDEVLGSNPRQLSELYSLKQNSKGQENFEDIVDAYLAYLQVTVVNPAMNKTLIILERFISDMRQKKIPQKRMFFGSAWRNIPSNSMNDQNWAKIQLIDFVQSFVNTEFGVNYLADDTFEIFDDPVTCALSEVGLLYTQRDPSFIRPVSCGIQRCLLRWLVEQKMELSLGESIAFKWQRIFRGRSYRHLMKEVGYK